MFFYHQVTLRTKSFKDFSCRLITFTLMRSSIIRTRTSTIYHKIPGRCDYRTKLAKCHPRLKVPTHPAVLVPLAFEIFQSSTLQYAMADDQSYNTFLTKANQDPSANSSQHQSTSQAKSKFDPTTPQTSAIPSALHNLDTSYTSDADEPFEPIVLDYASHELPDAAQFASCVKKDEGMVEALEEGDFDPRGQYKEILSKVKEAGNGQVRCFRVEVSKTRAEYYVVSVGERKLVGVRAKAVES